MFRRVISTAHQRVGFRYPLIFLAVILALYAVALDQGRLLSLSMGDAAYKINWLHEFFHDIRHVAGFPCH